MPSITALLGQLQAQALRLSASPEARAADLRFSLRPKMGQDLGSFVTAIQEVLGSTTRILFICDQFEELFIHYADTQKFSRFVAQLGDLCNDKNLKAQFLFSMREEWVGSMIELRPYIPDIFTNALRLAPLRYSKARFALTFPAEKAGIKIEQDLVATVLQDLAAAYFLQREERAFGNSVEETLGSDRDPFVELPALQVVAEALWNTRGQATAPFTLSHYFELKALTASPRIGEEASV